ncbi:uncharacterized protein EV420DRAFT_1562052, partial [Desarmillaria tabescens]
MSAPNASLQVSTLAESSSPPYTAGLAKVAMGVIELLDEKEENRKDIKELCESTANVVIVINTLASMQGGKGNTCFKNICAEMEGCLGDITQQLKDDRKREGVFNADEFRDSIQAYRKRIDDLKIDFLIHVTGNCMLALTEATRIPRPVDTGDYHFHLRISKVSFFFFSFFFVFFFFFCHS